MIHGRVDDYGRALVRITVAHPSSGARRELDAWIDTGFTGALTLPVKGVEDLNLLHSSAVTGLLADGSTALLNTFQCSVEWLGRTVSTNAAATSGQFRLLGIQLLEDLILTIDYPARTVSLTPSPSA